MSIELQSGIVCGREHLVFGINCQDSVASGSFEYKGETYYFGVVADGCGEGEKSEVGASLATSFIGMQIPQLVMSGLEINQLLTNLFYLIDGNLRSEVLGYPENLRVEFVKNYLLFTLLGFIIGPKITAVFWLGDGVVVVDNEVSIKDQGNTPTYIAYKLIPRSKLKPPTAVLTGFEVCTIETAQLDLLAIATDGFSKEPSALQEVLAVEPNQSVQRRMNLLSSKQKRFKDDAAIVISRRIVSS